MRASTAPRRRKYGKWGRARIPGESGVACAFGGSPRKKKRVRKESGGEAVRPKLKSFRCRCNMRSEKQSTNKDLASARSIGSLAGSLSDQISRTRNRQEAGLCLHVAYVGILLITERQLLPCFATREPI